ncbi:hypothetical protein AB0932_07255 [Streptomyces sp. NPDC006682]|uniref:hypothetical protein n=1 Tax=unclassified Streptomyces TaxID=2593676 RepID=UPI003451353E
MLAQVPGKSTAETAHRPETAADLAGLRPLKVTELGERVLDIDQKGVIFRDGEPQPQEPNIVLRTRIGMLDGIADEDADDLRGGLAVPRPSEHRQPGPGV